MFKLAKPIFLKDLRKEKNITAFFAANFDCSGENAKLLITGASSYRITINGEFAGYGPGRAPHGYTRIDEIDIKSYISWGLNQIVIELASYNCDTLSNVNNPGFLQAEIIADNKVVAATGHNFVGFADVERTQKVMRLSNERAFSEVYIRKGGSMLKIPVETVENNLAYMIRKTSFPKYDFITPEKYAYKGKTEKNKCIEYPTLDFIHKIDADSKKGCNGFTKKEIEHKPLYDIIAKTFSVTDENLELDFPITIKKGEYAVLDMGKTVTGFIAHNVFVKTKTGRMIIGFNKDNYNGVFYPLEDDMINVLDYQMIDGEFQGESFEPYAFRYLYFFAIDGDLELNDVYVREYAYPVEQYPEINTCNETIKNIYESAVDIFRQSTIDIFMDSPSTRIGKFQDAFFTARTEFFLTGKTAVNDSMLNSVIVAREFEDIPKGLVPCCYPAETMGRYLPCTSLWYGLQIFEQIERTEQKPDKYQKVLQGIYDWFKENQTDDLKTNMLLYTFLLKYSALTDDNRILKEAQKIKEKIFKDSNKEIIYALWTGVLDLTKENIELLKALKTDDKTELLLRMELLLKAGEKELLLKETDETFKNGISFASQSWVAEVIYKCVFS